MDAFNNFDINLVWPTLVEYYTFAQHEFSVCETNLVFFILACIAAFYWLCRTCIYETKYAALEKKYVKLITHAYLDTKDYPVECCAVQPNPVSCDPAKCVELMQDAHKELIASYDASQKRFIKHMATQYALTLNHLEQQMKTYKSFSLSVRQAPDINDDDEDD